MSTSMPCNSSAAFFGPAPKLANKEILSDLRRQILASNYLEPLAKAIKDLPKLWDKISRDERARQVAFSSRGGEYAQGFREWMERGQSDVIAGQTSTIVSLPTLLVRGICQWCRYLELSGYSQAEVLSGLGVGGVQGYCGGIFAAIAVASARDADELGRRAANAFRTAFLVGVLISEGEDSSSPELAPALLIVQLKYPGQEEELARRYSGYYIGARTTPLRATFAGTTGAIAPLREYVASQGMSFLDQYPTGSAHNPENVRHVDNLVAMVAEDEDLALPRADQLIVPVLSNWDGERLVDTSHVAKNVLGNFLYGRCEWYTLVTKVAQRLCGDGSGQTSHTLLLVDGFDCVSVDPFQQASLQVAKIDVVGTIKELERMQAELAGFADDAVAVVGAACRLPGASNLDELWEMMEKSESRCEEIRPDRIPLYGSHRASLDAKFTTGRKFWGNFLDDVDQFDHEMFRLSTSEAAWMDPQQRILLELTYEALDSYGHLGHRSHRRDAGLPVGCFLGGTLIEYNEHTSSHAATAYSAISTMQAFQCGRISHHFGWYGPSETIDTACSSSLVAISRACNAIRGGECSMAIAGGANILGGVNYYLDLAKARFLSPTGQCKVFDAAADGYCRADGAGVVVLKRLKDAIASGDELLAVIAGAGTNQGGLSRSITLPDQAAQAQLYRRVVRQAGLEPSDISYIECHGTGTQAGDPNEIAGLRSVFGDTDREHTLYVGSVKGNIGHAEAAAGVTGLLKVMAMLGQGKIAPQASFVNLNPDIGSLGAVGMAIATETQPWNTPTRRALVNSYGAAGSNASLVVCQPPNVRPKNAWWLPRGDRGDRVDAAVSTWPLLVTAASAASLTAQCRELAQMVQLKEPNVGDMLWTLSEKRQRHRFRVALLIRDREGLAVALQQAASSPTAPTTSASQVLEKGRRVVLVFGGQSRRTVHLDRHLYNTSPPLRRHLEDCDAILRELGHRPVVPAILDPQELDHDVVLLQVATFVIQYSCAKTWEDAGLRVDAAVGHSFGELTALVFSGALSLRDGIRVVTERASLMETAWGKEKGAMLAIHAPLSTVQAVASCVSGLEIACHNAPTSHVVVGAAPEIEKAAALVAERFPGTRCQRVDVTHGFHSRFVDDLLQGLRQLDDSLTFEKPRLHLELCLPEPGEPSRGHIGRHARNPVFFAAALTRLARRLGPCAWLEAGTDSPIIAMAKRAVPDPSIHSFHPLKFEGSHARETVLCEATVGLWREGVDATYWPWVGATGMRPVRLPRYKFAHKSSFWKSWIDHPAEIERRLAAEGLGQSLLPSATAGPTHMLIALEQPHRNNRFSVNVGSSRFQQLVSGHAVRGRPMCPASMYMECVAMAVQIHEANANRDFPGSGVALQFGPLTFEWPLSLRPGLQVSILLEPETSIVVGRSWIFSVETTILGGEEQRPTVHLRGVVALVPSPDTRHLQALLCDRARQLKAEPTAETILSRRVYSLFSHLVDYSPALRGIESLTLNGNWVVGTIKPPRPVVATHETESSVLALADAAVADNFLQVLGLAINTSEVVAPGEAFLVSAIDTFTLTTSCRFGEADAGPWTVASRFSIEENSRSVTGDVYILDEHENVVASALGVRFTQVRLNSLGRLLNAQSGELAPKLDVASNNQRPTPSTFLPEQETKFGEHASRPSLTSSLPRPPAPSEEPQQQVQAPEVALLVRDIVARYTGAAVGDMFSDTTLAELGVDSLAVVEFADTIGSTFDKQFGTDELSNMSVQALIDACSSASACVGRNSSLSGSISSALSSATTPDDRSAKTSADETSLTVDLKKV